MGRGEFSSCRNFFSFNFPLREFFFLYFARPPPHKFFLVRPLERPLSFFPKVAVNWICYPWKCYSHKNAWGHKKWFTLSCSPRAMTWSIRKDKSPQSLKNDAISLWKLGTLSSGQTLTTGKCHNKNYIRWLLGIKKNPYDQKKTKVLQIKKMIDNS